MSTIRIQALPRFPASVEAGDGILVERGGGVFTFSIDPEVVPGFSDMNISVVSLGGAAQTYTAAQAIDLISRSSSGSAMRDTLPGTSPGVLTDRTVIHVANDDAAALLEIRSGSGATLDGDANKYIVLGPGQRASFVSDGANYHTVSAPERARIAQGMVTTLHVAASGGSDNNSGISAAVPFATRQHAVDVIYSRYDFNASKLDLQHAAGTYADTGVLVRGRPPGIGNSSSTLPFAHAFTLRGDPATPANVVLNVTGIAFQAVNNVTFHIDGFKVVSSSHAIDAENAGTVLGVGNMEYGACGGDHMRAGNGAYIHFDNDYTISGGAAIHKHTFNGGVIFNSGATNVTVTGTPAFGTTIFAETCGLIVESGLTYTGAATGTKWVESLGGKIGAAGRVFNTVFPGSANGSNTDISALGAAAAVADTDIVAVNQSGGVNLKQTFAAIKAWIRSGSTAGEDAAAGTIGQHVIASTAETGQGQNGATVTMTIASPCVVTWGTTVPYTKDPNGVATAMAINFTTTGALPTGIVAGTNYYVIGQSISGNTFRIASSVDNAIAGIAINTSGSQSGTHTGVPTALLTSGAAPAVAAIALPAGDWDVCVDVVFLSAATTSVTQMVASATTVLALSGSSPGTQAQRTTAAQVPGVANNVLHAGPRRAKVTATTTIYCTALSVFTVSTLAAWGGCHARRVR